MFLVGGGILTHGLPGAHHWIEHLAEQSGAISGIGPLLAGVMPTVIDAFAGLLAGAVVLALLSVVQKFVPEKA
jgi:predicted DNA repair protein MutK